MPDQMVMSSMGPHFFRQGILKNHFIVIFDIDEFKVIIFDTVNKFFIVYLLKNLNSLKQITYTFN